MHNVQVSAIGGGMPPHGKRSVTITVELPDELADEAEALQAADPAFLPRAVLYGAHKAGRLSPPPRGGQGPKHRRARVVSLPLDEALSLAQDVADTLGPLVAELKCVGSVRRKRPRVGDIEFLARPHAELGLFGERGAPIVRDVRDALHGIGRWLRGGDRQMVVTDLYGAKGVRLEVYLQHPPAEWGSLLAIRTGPGDLGRYCVTRMRARGFLHKAGRVIRIGSGEHVPTRTEEDFFACAGVECLPPGRRDAQARSLWAAYAADKRRGEA